MKYNHRTFTCINYHISINSSLRYVTLKIEIKWFSHVMTHHYNSITTQKTKQNFIAVTILFMVVFVEHGSHLFFADFYLKKKKRQFIISFSRMACWLPTAVSVSAALFTTDRMWGICFSYMKNFMVVVYLFQIRTRSGLILAHYLFMVCCELCIHNRVTTFAISFYVYLS